VTEEEKKCRSETRQAMHDCCAAATALSTEKRRQATAQIFLETMAHRMVQITADYVNLLHRQPASSEVMRWVNTAFDLGN
jgi:hypothetical protein